MRTIRWPVLAAAAVLVAGSGTAYAVTSDKSHGNYRTVAATKGDVEQVLQTSGTVDAAHRADLEFATSGTVARVKVAIGDTVKAGQVVATLDTESLEAAVTKAKASVARAVAQLASDEDAQAQAVSDAASSPQGSKPQGNTPQGSAPTAPTGGSTSAATLAALKAQQDAVTQAQTAASAAIAAAKDALTAQTAACAAAYQSPAATSDDDDATEPDASDDDTACSAALTAVQARQDDVAAAQDALAKALSSLAATLSKALAALSSSDGSSNAASHARTAADDSSGTDTPTGNSSDSAGGAVTAAQLAADQASIEQARADLVEARQQLRQAVLRSTRSGRVVALDVARGDDVSAGDVAATVVGGTAVTVGTTVPESKVDQVRVGQHVRVTTPGESSDAEGTVTAIGLVADNSSGTASYPVTVTVEDPTIALPAGSEAMLAIVVMTAHDVVTVPTSAITRRGQGTDAFVQTWDGTTLSREAVTIGTVGARTVEVTKGLSAGDRVVLADVDQAITGASDELNDRGRFGKAPVFQLDKGGAGGGGPVTFKSGG